MTTLNDEEIGVEIAAGRLIRNYDLVRLGGACYELRMGSVYYDLTEGGSRLQLTPGELVLIKPGHRVVLMTREELEIPSDILVRIISKGSLFSIGLSPIATYADPGFFGNIGLVTVNTSDKYLVLPQDEPIAKADFTRLRSGVSKPYRGQHGFQAGVWPIKTHLQKTYAQVAADPRVRSETQEALILLPAATRSIIRRIEVTQYVINIGIFIAIIFNAISLFNLSGHFIDAFLSAVINLATSAIVGIISICISMFRKT
jgi:dCTP deaminase